VHVVGDIAFVAALFGGQGVSLDSNPNLLGAVKNIEFIWLVRHGVNEIFDH